MKHFVGHISYDGGYTWLRQWMGGQGNITEEQVTRIDWTFAPKMFQHTARVDSLHGEKERYDLHLEV